MMLRFEFYRVELRFFHLLQDRKQQSSRFHFLKQIIVHHRLRFLKVCSVLWPIRPTQYLRFWNTLREAQGGMGRP